MHTRSRLRVEPLEDRLTPNNRFVVPYSVTANNASTFHTLASALTSVGLAGSLTAGDVVEIEPFSTPGPISNSNVTAINAANVTIRGASGFAPNELPLVRTADAIVVPAADAGLTLQNLNLQVDYTLTFNANGSVRNSTVVVGSTGGHGIVLNGTPAAVLQGNTITNSGVNTGNDIIHVTLVPSSANLIDGNVIRDTFGNANLLTFSGSVTTSDVVSNNTFSGADALEQSHGPNMIYASQASGLTIRNNTFRDDTAEDAAIYLDSTTNTQIIDNQFALKASVATPSEAALKINGTASLPLTATVRGNSFATGPNGRAIDMAVNDANVFNVKVERNTFLENKVGVNVIASAPTASVGGIDLGGGGLGSVGGNNFRGFVTAATSSAGAVVMASTANVAGQNLLAKGDLFGVANPETVIWDNADNAIQADVLPTNAPTGNAAFVQALYTRYLHRVGNLNGASDAGGWVTFMTAGGSQAQVANSIIRSPEALGYVVDDLYRTILGREADATGRAYHVNLLASGWTVEQVQMGLYGGAEYAVRFPGNAAYVTSLFDTLLDRVPDAGGLNSWLNQLPTLGRAGVAAGFVNSAEYRNRVVRSIYFDLLKRTTANAPTAADIATWVNTGMDVLSLQIAFAGTQEFYLYG